MRETKFTKGEWVARTERYGGMEIGIVHIKGGGFDVSGAPDPVANANLIAAAPDMYKAADATINLLTSLGMQNTEEYRLLVKSTNKARGES